MVRVAGWRFTGGSPEDEAPGRPIYRVPARVFEVYPSGAFRASRFDADGLPLTGPGWLHGGVAVVLLGPLGEGESWWRDKGPA